MSVKDAVQEVYDTIPFGNFNGIYVITRVRRLLRRPSMFADTILRQLRQLKQDGTVQYSTICRSKSKYKKE